MTAIQVVFRNDNLIVIDHNNTPYVPMRPIVEGMGLAWVAQFVKLKSNTRFSVTEIITQLPNDIQQRKVACMPLRKLPGWLSTIYPNKVKPELRDKIIAYQNECDDILWAAWQRQRPELSITDDPLITLEENKTLMALLRRAMMVLPPADAESLKAAFKSTYFQVSKVRRSQFQTAMGLVQGYLGAPHQSFDFNRIKGGQRYHVWRDGDKIVMKEMRDNEFVISEDRLAEYIGDSGGMVSRAVLPDILHAIAKRM